MENCIFCKIIAGNIPALKVFEDEESLAFLDIHPVTKGHILLIPKIHIEWIQDVPDVLLSSMFSKTKKLIHSMKESLLCDYVQISIVGKDVPHFHIHLIPRFFDDNLPGFPTLEYQNREAEVIQEKISHALHEV
jgi:histidine triad (HIT) family protein